MSVKLIFRIPGSLDCTNFVDKAIQLYIVGKDFGVYKEYSQSVQYNKCNG